MALSTLAIGLAVAGSAAAQRVAGNIISPAYPWLYQYPLPQPPVAQPSYTFNTSDGRLIEYYQIDIEPFTAQVYPNLGPANVIGFNGSVPGPTFRVKKGVESIVRYTNKGNYSASTHLHGSWTRSPWDGWADDIVPVGSFKDYYYPNSQTSRTLWYHDHADNHTAVDAYYGQHGFWIIYDEDEDSLGLPKGKYDVPMTISDAAYKSNGDLQSPANEYVNFYGDTIEVNGQPWPYFKVEPRKYRFRVLNPSLSRPYEIYVADSQGNWQDLHIIASDGGYFPTPVVSNRIEFAMAERYEFIIDFANFKGQNLTMGNNLNIPGVQNYDNTDKVMRFVVGNDVSDTSNNNIPSSIGVELPPEPANRETVDHVFNFQRTANKWTINGVDYNEPAARILARPPAGTVENWQLRYASGPGVHPIHIHLVDFKIVSRSGGRNRGVESYESAGMKDIAYLEPGEVVDVVANYGPWNGQYMFHCHNLIHEDHEMMDVFNTTILEDMGYADWMQFDDPVDTRFAPTVSADHYYDAQSITATLMPSLASLNAYRNLDSITASQSSYYATHGYGEGASAYSTAAPDSQSVLATDVGGSGSGPGVTNVPFSNHPDGHGHHGRRGAEATPAPRPSKNFAA